LGDIQVNNTQVQHIPVLAAILAEQINLPSDGVMVDATIGHGGHSYLFGSKLGPNGTIVGFDVDEKSLQTAREKLKELSCKVVLIHSNFSRITEQLCNYRIEKVDFILADLGVSSGQLADEQIGLSFMQNMPLDMRIDKRIKTTAADIINKMDEKSLADLIYKFGEDRASRRIARFIVQYREGQEIITTGQLANIVSRALSNSKRYSRIHPATRTFQALRIAVNDELANLEELLGCLPSLLKESGKIAIISFHSLEDRLVKNNFKKNEKEGIYKIITKKPIVPCEEEVNDNPRARSAKLRIAEKVSN
jgi:16S rRNA (cytosine1402-N4)-methyltransferase